MKAVHFWTDAGFGKYNLYYLRDKAKREVDFLVTRDNTPWLMADVKSSVSKRISPHLEYFSNLLKVKHAFQVELDGEYVDRDCFSTDGPIKVE